MIHDLPTELDRGRILNTLNGLPPVSAFLNATSDQETHLRAVREYFQDLKQALTAYFAGQPNPVGRDDVKRKRLIEQEVSYYLDIYNLFWFGWTEIQSEVSRHWELVQQSDYKFQAFPDTPGEALTLILELDCDAMTHVCVAGGKVSSYESYNLLQGLPDPSLAKGSQKKRVDRTVHYADEVLERSESGFFLLFCQNAVKKRLRGNPTLQTQLKRFRATQSKRLSGIRRMLKTEKIRGQTWIEGEVREA
jgi:hypothetical protein